MPMGLNRHVQPSHMAGMFGSPLTFGHMVHLIPPSVIQISTLSSSLDLGQTHTPCKTPQLKTGSCSHPTAHSTSHTWPHTHSTERNEGWTDEREKKRKHQTASLTLTAQEWTEYRLCHSTLAVHWLRGIPWAARNAVIGWKGRLVAVWIGQGSSCCVI